MRFIASLLLMSCLSAGAQYREEIWWAVWHPIAAVRVKCISRQCDPIYKVRSPELDSYSNGGRQDAFRHVFYMSAYASRIRGRKVKRLGIAHEKANHRQFCKGTLEEGFVPDSLSSVMDLRNNAVGIALGKQHRHAPLSELAELAKEEIEDGRAWILKRDANGNFITCDGAPIAPADYRNRWFLPKCLVQSGSR